MHAVIRTGGKQYRVAAQDVIRIEKIAGEEGDAVLFDEVLAVGSELGAPLVSGASVAGRVIAQMRDDKIVVFKKKRRQNYRRKQGHRQARTVVRIEEILTGGKKPAAAKKAPAKKAPAKEPEEKKPEAKKAAAKKSPKKAEAAPKAEPAPKVGAQPAAQTGAQTGSGPDDLKKLPGVGPATEKKLNALGITTYAQIAALTAEEIAQVDAALKLKGKIEQDDWPALAKELAGKG
ncbi:MAG: 50S ribosomal protein L21 [Rhodospirillaceae bacterium]|nr:50S ribosomal protein L21 [Rhodospirillaceae bacterium]